MKKGNHLQKKLLRVKENNAPTAVRSREMCTTLDAKTNSVRFTRHPSSPVTAIWYERLPKCN